MKMRAFLTAAITLALLATVAEASGSEARAGGRTEVACIPPSFDRIAFKDEPRHCVFVKRGGEGFGNEIVGIKSLNWDHWGHPHATAEGTALFNMGATEGVKVLLSKPKTICGHRVYSKVKFKFDGGGSADEKLDTCPRSL